MLETVLLSLSPRPTGDQYPSILAVNDNPDSLDLLCAVFSDDGFRILTAENAVTALQIAETQKPDLIISDVVMPGMDGIELCRRLKINPSTCHIPILLLTALRYDESSILEGLRAGADDYMQTLAPIELMRKKVQVIINERKRIEAARLEGEQHFQALIENSLDIITALNADGTIRYESPSVAGILGYDPQELIGRSVFDFIHPDDISGVLKIFNLGTQIEGYTDCIEYRFRHKDGSWRVLESRGKNLLSQPGVQGVIVNSRDMTERKQIETQLRESEERYKLLIHGVKDYAVFMLDPNGCVITWNSGAERIAGYRSEEILGQPFSRLYTEEDIEQGEPALELKITADTGSYEREGWYARPDGSCYWANVVITALQDEQGSLKGFSLITRDITKRRDREEALRRSEMFMRAVLDNSPSLVSVKNLQGQYMMVNRQFEAMFQLTFDDVVGKTVHAIFPKEMADLSRSYDRQVIESGKPLEVEETVVSEDGPRRYLSIRFPLNNAEDQPYAICDISTDITTYKALEEQLRQSQKMEALGRLSGGIAHDFNNLLTAIIGYSEFVLCKIDKSNPLCGYIGEIEKAGHRAAALTTQLLAFSRKQILQPQTLNLNERVADLNKMLRRLIGEDIELVTNLSPDLEVVKADQGHLEQVIINLAVNARDAMPQGGTLIIETANVQLNSEYASSHMGVAAGEYVMLAVSDTGSGMSKETQARIFEPFFTTKEKGEGTGLGLSTVYGIVKQSGGHIWVYSEMDHGSTFKIYLPRSEGTAGTETVASLAKACPGWETILLVEDAEPVRQLTRMILETNGYTVLEADCGKEALWQAQGYGGEIALLVTDVVMPEISGIAVASTLGLTRPEMKVLYLSGYTEEVVNRHGLLNQGVAFLQKPFTPETLAREVRRVLEA